MLPLLLTITAHIGGGQTPPPPRPTVLLVALEAKTDPETQDYKNVFPLTSRDGGVVFDLDGDGASEQVAWTVAGAPVAFLAIDINENGTIDNGKELVGRQILDGAPNAVHALIKMREKDTSKPSGNVSQGDGLYEKLLLWRDSNHNGVSEPSELRPARELLTRVGLGYGKFERPDDHGNAFRYQGWVEMRTAPGLNEPNGPGEHFQRTRRMYEVVLTR